MPNDFNKGNVLFPEAPKCATFAVEFTLAAEFESYTVRLMNGQPVFVTGDFSSVVEFLENQRQNLLNDERKDE